MLGLTLGFADCAVSHLRTTSRARRTSSSDEHHAPRPPDFKFRRAPAIAGTASPLVLAPGLATSVCGPPPDWHRRPGSRLAFAARLPTRIGGATSYRIGGRRAGERWHSAAHTRSSRQYAGARRRTRFWPPPENLREKFVPQQYATVLHTDQRHAMSTCSSKPKARTAARCTSTRTWCATSAKISRINELHDFLHFFSLPLLGDAIGLPSLGRPVPAGGHNKDAGPPSAT